MSARDWQPGDIAMVKCSDGSERRALAREMTGGLSWAFSSGAFRYVDESEARPLVTFDPEAIASGVSGRLLSDILYAAASQTEWDEPSATRTIAAFRALSEAVDAALAPPKPPEPTGDGAVVLDSRGRRWTRLAAEGYVAEGMPRENLSPPWRCRGLSGKWWDQVDAVEVLGEGVQP